MEQNKLIQPYENEPIKYKIVVDKHIIKLHIPIDGPLDKIKTLYTVSTILDTFKNNTIALQCYTSSLHYQIYLCKEVNDFIITECNKKKETHLLIAGINSKVIVSHILNHMNPMDIMQFIGNIWKHAKINTKQSNINKSLSNIITTISCKCNKAHNHDQMMLDALQIEYTNQGTLLILGIALNIIEKLYKNNKTTKN